MNWLFLPVQAGKPWTGATIHTDPLGGSEAAVAYTARALAKKGHRVSVLTHGAKTVETFEGVQYWPNSALSQLQRMPFDVLVSSRWIEALGWNWNAMARMLWMHDMPYQIGGQVPVHKIVCVSEFQAAVWGFDPASCVVIGNGVDLEIFSPSVKVERNPNKLVWASNPDRGLALAAKIFQEIRKRWPDLELHVYGRAQIYGWDQSAEAPYMPLDEHMENVFMHDSLPRYALAHELRNAWALFYPTWWPETYCMTALEAQAVGTPVISSPHAALASTVVGGIQTFDYLNAVSQLRNVRRWKKLSAAGIEFATHNTWDIRATQWEALATEVQEAINAVPQ